MAQNQEYKEYSGNVTPGYLQARNEMVPQQGRQQKTYTMMNIGPGHKVLDIGCGPASDTLFIAEWVGETGRVIGIDTDDEMVTEANRLAENAGVNDWVEHKYGDILALPFPDHYFDACHCKHLFMHLLEPELALAEMIRVTKPNGRIAVVEVDGGTASTYNTEIETERQLVKEFARRINNPYAGRQLPYLFHKQQLADISIDIFVFQITDLTQARYILKQDERNQRAIEMGLVTKEEVQRYCAVEEEIDKVGGYFFQTNLVTVVGSKPE